MKNINGLKVLERHDFERFCPSFYAEHPKAGVSDKYAFLNTRDIAVQLWDLGWLPVHARESRSVDPSNRGFTRHIVRWAHKDLALNGERVELVGTNSHNRASAFSFMAGVFRLICSNGMIAKTSDFGAFKIKHIGNIADQVTDAVRRISGVAGEVAGKLEEYKTITLEPNEQGVFAAAAHSYLYKDPETAPIQAGRLLTPRRAADAGLSFGTRIHNCDRPKPDLWTTFNVVQENVMKGGLSGRNVDTRRKVKTRKVSSIEKDVKLNQALWEMTEKMAELKRAA